MRLFLSLFASAVFASESIISPLPDYSISPHYQTQKPHRTFREIAIHPKVLGVQTESNTTLATPPAVQNTQEKELKKKSLSIALLGDSMIDTLGPEFTALQTALQLTYPNLQTNIFNYGVGATNIEYGIERITTHYEYLGKKFPSLVSLAPDIIILESFGYNPFPEKDAINKHWLLLAKACDTIKTHLPNTQIIIAATIAPNSTKFADGAAGLSFTLDEKRERTRIINEYLASTIRFAKGEKYPLADAYTASKTEHGDGNLLYINAGDHIHPSDAGRKLFADTIVATITESGLIK